MVGICSLIYLIVSLFIGKKSVPVSCFLAHVIVFKGDYSSIDTSYESWTVILAKLFGFVATICFIFLGTYIVYYKALVKVDTLKQIQGMAFYVMISFGVVGLCHAILVIICAANATYGYDASMPGITAEDIKSKGNVASMVSSLFELIFFSFEFFLFFFAYILSKRALVTMLEFHDYLITYRLTPRSRIFRKHMPRMTMVIEEESDYDG